MPAYRYSAIDKNGKIHKGIMEVESIEELEITLKNKRLLLIEFSQEKNKNKNINFNITFFEKKISTDELIQFFSSLGGMLSKGMKLTETLEYIKNSLDKKYTKQIIDNIIISLRKGNSFSEAIQTNAKFFPEFVIEPISLGEKTGKLSEVLLMIANQLEKNKNIKDKIKKASIYPCFVTTFLVILITVVFNFVFPRIVKGIKEILSGQNYPPITKMILLITDKIKIIAPFIPLIFLFFVVLILIKNKIPMLKNFFDTCQLKIPYLRDIILFKEIINFLQVLLIGIQSGIPLVKSLSIAENNINNSIIKNKIIKIKTSISLGESIINSFKSASLHPYLEAMISTGETTGSLDESLENALNFYNSRMDEKIDKFFAWLEPIIIIFLGITVLFVLLGALIPMWESTSYIVK